MKAYVLLGHVLTLQEAVRTVEKHCGYWRTGDVENHIAKLPHSGVFRFHTVDETQLPVRRIWLRPL